MYNLYVSFMNHEQLFKILASFYHMYIKIQNYHWNVKGSRFFSIHNITEKFYENKAEIIDEIAERISQLGDYVDASFENYTKHSVVKEPATNMTAEEMLKDLVTSYDAIYLLLYEAAKKYEKDIATMDLITKLLVRVEKERWIISSMH